MLSIRVWWPSSTRAALSIWFIRKWLDQNELYIWVLTSCAVTICDCNGLVAQNVCVNGMLVSNGPTSPRAQVKAPSCLSSFVSAVGGLLAHARWILRLARKPSAEAVVGFQITDLPLVGHGVLQDAD